MYFITTKRMLEVCFSAHPNIQYRTENRICIVRELPSTSSSFFSGFMSENLKWQIIR